MIHPVPKQPPKQKKPRTRLKVNKPLKAKTRLKTKSKNTLPDLIIKELFKRDNHQCQNPKCGSTYGLQPHHVKRKSGASPEWIHDLRNLITLCWICHGLTETDQGLYRYIQLIAVKRFGWFAGKVISIKEFIDKYLIGWLLRKSMSVEEYNEKYGR